MTESTLNAVLLTLQVASVATLLVLTAETHINPGQPEVRRNFDRVHNHVLDPRITNRPA